MQTPVSVCLYALESRWILEMEGRIVNLGFIGKDYTLADFSVCFNLMCVCFKLNLTKLTWSLKTNKENYILCIYIYKSLQINKFFFYLAHKRRGLTNIYSSIFFLIT